MTNPTSQEKLIQAKLIKTEIPISLSKLILQGKKEEALELLVAWGAHQKDEQTILNEANTLLKV